MTDLNNVMESLLAENGCPWDKVQTHETLKNLSLIHIQMCIRDRDKIDNDIPRQIGLFE